MEIGSAGHERESLCCRAVREGLTDRDIVKRCEGSKRVSYTTIWRKNIPSKGHSKCKGSEARGLVLLKDMQRSQELELSEVRSEMEGLKWDKT